MKLNGRGVEEYYVKARCQHSIENDRLFAKNKKIQLWFLNFCKYICLCILKKDEENVNSKLIGSIEANYEPISTRKQSLRLLANKNLASAFKEFTEEEKAFITSKQFLQRLL